MRSRSFGVLPIAVAFLAGAAWAQDCSKDTITVTGMGKVTAKPDVAYVTLRVQGDGILMVDAAQKAKQRVEEVEKAIKAKQGSVKEIVVSDVSVGKKGSSWSSDTPDEAQRPEIVKQMRVTIAPDPQVAFDVIDAAIRAGASMDISESYSYGGLSDSVVVYGLLKSEAAEDQAQAKALEDARSKANKLAALAGKAVGEVTGIGCEGATSWPYQLEMRGAGRFPITSVGVDPTGIEINYGMSVTFQMVKK